MRALRDVLRFFRITGSVSLQKSLLMQKDAKEDLLLDSASYWQNRYQEGGNSGPGSYGILARYKAEIINDFVSRNSVISVIEFGCGDGNQLALASYPSYTGFDISDDAIALCCSRFKSDSTKIFRHMQEYGSETADLVLSLDVVYHLVEDEIYAEYMARLFAAACKYVIVYSSNFDQKDYMPSSHVRHRCFTKWVRINEPNWQLTRHIPNSFPYVDNLNQGSLADFFVFSRINN